MTVFSSTVCQTDCGSVRERKPWRFATSPWHPATRPQTERTKEVREAFQASFGLFRPAHPTASPLPSHAPVVSNARCRRELLPRHPVATTRHATCSFSCTTQRGGQTPPKRRKRGISMKARMSNLSGEQLLLAAVLRGPLVHVRVESELDRRALLCVPRDRSNDECRSVGRREHAPGHIA